MMKLQIEKIAKEFQISGYYLSGKIYGSGHINDTYIVFFKQSQGQIPYIIQRINHLVFTEPVALMENIVRVTEHIRNKLRKSDPANIISSILEVIPTRTGSNHYLDPRGNYWRAYTFIPNAFTVDVIQSPNQAFQAAKIYGCFQKLLDDLPGPPLHETIPGFHNVNLRLRQLQQVITADPQNRVKPARDEIDFVFNQTHIFSIVSDLVEQGKIPMRVTHNDTKINNVLFDKQSGNAMSIVDLDTVMPGLSLYDFGDLARTILSPAAEDEQDLSRVEVDIPVFIAMVKGFLSGANGFLNQAEMDHLVCGAKFMTLLIGIRFLSVFLNGDTYFKVHREGHNLDRSRVQFKLYRSMLRYEEKMSALVRKYTDSGVADPIPGN